MPNRTVTAVRPSLALALFRAMFGPDKPLTPELANIVKQALVLLKQYKRNMYSLGALYAASQPLALKAGFHNVDDFWIRNIPTSDVTVRQMQVWGRVASIWNPDIVAAYSVVCLYLYASYCAQRELDASGDPGDRTVGFADDSGYHVEKRFRDCTEADMKLAVFGKKEPDKLPEREQEIFDRVQKIIQGAIFQDHKTRLTGKMEGIELFFDLFTSLSLLPLIVEALHDWALEREGTLPSSAKTERKAKAKKAQRRRR